MTNPGVMKNVCIHGHFYQPPRENPWLEEIEREDSAAPNHDWNEQISSECYRANAAARLVDDKNRILSLHNNYKSLSYNFGPTLLRWLENFAPAVYEAIIEADRESCERFNGHGNAMAQVYNHLIMPLANYRDKVTQVTWGIRDFEHRFGRRPEGMWLSETAVDHDTLEIMAEAGIRFTILSPFQADRFRYLDKSDVWHDAKGGNIPTGRAYRYRCRTGKHIHLFFYEPSLAKGIAFERLLEHSSKLLNQINEAYLDRNAPEDEPWLVNTATDGESYGHHFKFGDMALAAALVELERDPTARVMNYGTFLASHPVVAEAQIVENSAWSCAHGLGRWERDCGCHIGGQPGWNQKWRGPVREALNHLRDHLAEHYEREMGTLSKDPWKARDEYIEVLLDPEHRTADFLDRHSRSALSEGRTARFFQLLEMQRCAMFMYTSCGWFFDEVSGLETVLILRYAARAIQLAEQTGASSLEPSFLEILEKAPSNLPEYGNGAAVYEKKVKPEVVRKERVAASYAIQLLARSSHRRYRVYGFDIVPQHEEDLGSTPAPCLYGHIRVRDGRTLEEEGYLYAVLHFGGLDFRCSVKPYSNDDEYASILGALQQSVEEQNTVNMVRILDRVFGTTFFSLHDVFRDMRSSIALEISQDTLAAYTHFQSHLYNVYRPLMMSLRQWGIRIPGDLRVAVRRILSDEVRQLVKEVLAHEQKEEMDDRNWEEMDFFYRSHLGRLHSLLDEAKSWSVAVRLGETSVDLGRALTSSLTALRETLESRLVGKVFRLLKVCRILRAKPELWKSQTLYFAFVGEVLKNPDRVSRVHDFEGFMKELDEFLECRFARLLDGLPSFPPSLLNKA